jgi:ABC-type multidrug transport system fused ATPase/permease subunit
MAPLPEPLPSLAVRYFRQFWGYAGPRILILVVLTVVMSYAEGIGIALFYPLFETSNGASPNNASGMVAHVLDVLHVPMTAASVLPLIMGLFLAKGLLQYVTYRYLFRLVRNVTGQLRRRALDALAAADYQHVAGANAGFYTNLLVNEVNRAAGGFQYFVRALSPALSAGVLFAMVWFLDWRLSLACVAMGLVMIGLTRVTGMIIRRYSIVVSRESSGLTSLLIQILHAFKYLRATGSYERFERRVWTSSEKILDADFKAANANSFTLAMTQPIMIVFLGAMLYYRAVIQGAELASLFVLLLYFFRVMNEVFQLQNAWQGFIGYTGSVELVRDATVETERAAEPNGKEPFAGLRDAIVFDHVDFSYRTGRQVLAGIDVRIPARSMVAFVGGSGAGKSTLVDLLTGTLRASAGRVSFDGHNLATMDLATLRRRVGYVPQDAVLFDDTVSANIALWADNYTLDQVRDAARRARCLDFIEQMPNGFDTPVGDRGVKLSGGQRQRLAIARELLRAPELLVLDEATSALDSESERAIQQSIDQLKGQMTIVIIAHRLSTIRGSDRVYVLNDGKIVEDGQFDELAARPNGRFRRMVELQEVAG